MKNIRHTEFKHRDFFIPRTTKEIYGVYLTFDDPLPWYKRERTMVVVVCISIFVLAFSAYKGVV